MNCSLSWRWLAIISILLYCRVAHAGGALLVAVELAPGALVSADEVRAAIASETKDAVTAALDANVDVNSEALIVAVDAGRAALTYHARQGDARRRQIELPAGRNKQLQTLAWIALNLVRDQVQGLVGDSPKDGNSATATVSTPSSEDPPLSNLEPPPVSPQTRGSQVEPPAVQSARAEELSKPASPWSVSLFGGPRMHPFDYDWTFIHYRDGNEWELEIQRNYEGWTLGVALDMGPDDRPTAGLAPFAGDGWHWHTLRLEGTAGIGLELVQRYTKDSVSTYSSVTGQSSSMTVHSTLRAALYGRGNATLSWQVRHAVALTFRLALHLETENVFYCYGSALLGVRVTLP
jgi:hypothetical protein